MERDIIALNSFFIILYLEKHIGGIMNRLFKTIIGTFFSLSLVCLIFYVTHPIGQTGEQWLMSQNTHVNSIIILTDEMDNIVTLYLSDNINESDFLSHVEILEQECKLLKANYQTEEKKIPVKTGTHTYFTKIGTENISSLYDNILDIIEMLKTNSGNKEVLSYKYLAFQQEIAEKATG